MSIKKSCPVCKHRDVEYTIISKTVVLGNQKMIANIGICDNCGVAYLYEYVEVK